MASVKLTDANLPATVALLEDLPLSIMVYRLDGLLVAMNQQAEQFWATRRSEIVGTFNILQDPQSVAQGSPALFERVRRGETVETQPELYDTTKVAVERLMDQQIWIQATIFPLHDAAGAVSHVVLMHRNVTEQVEQAQAIDAAQMQINAQREIITELSSPVVQVWDGVLTMPLVGSIDSRRAMMVTENLLHAIAQYSADIVILDITGVPLVDTAVANYLVGAARAARLLGCEVAIVGIRSEIAQTIVQLGIDMSQFTTRADLKDGIAWAFQRRGLRVTLRK